MIKINEFNKSFQTPILYIRLSSSLYSSLTIIDTYDAKTLEKHTPDTFKSECPRKSKSRKLQKIDFLLTKHIEGHWYGIKQELH